MSGGHRDAAPRPRFPPSLFPILTRMKAALPRGRPGRLPPALEPQRSGRERLGPHQRERGAGTGGTAGGPPCPGAACPRSDPARWELPSFGTGFHGHWAGGLSITSIPRRDWLLGGGSQPAGVVPPPPEALRALIGRAASSAPCDWWSRQAPPRPAPAAISAAPPASRLEWLAVLSIKGVAPPPQNFLVGAPSDRRLPGD